ncbi:MAG: CotH kinase family protein [bacterium]
MRIKKQYNYAVICLLMLLTFSQELYPKIVINEIMSSNSKILQDEDGDFPDWIELYNSGDYTENLENWYLTDDAEEVKWRFPFVNLAPDKYLIIFCSDKDKFDGFNLHTNFKLNSEGETIRLLEKNLILVDKLNPVELTTDISYGRIPDGTNNFSLFFNPSPGKSNNNMTQMSLIEFSKKGGLYLYDFDLTISKALTDDDIYYTLDGSEPTDSSYLYTGPIRIKNKNGLPNIFSMIRTNPENAPESYRWLPPKGEVYKATVIRAAPFKKGVRSGKVISATYFVDPNIYNRYTFPIISIITDSLNFFGFNEGIYIPGKVHAENPETSWYWGTGNYHQKGDEWERPVYIELFEPDGKPGFSQDAGVRIHGSGGRALPEKSLRLYARSEYGKNTFQYQLFPQNNKTEFKRFILRNSGQDFLNTLFTDILIQDLSRNIGIEFQEWRPSIVFINGEYWGIHNIRERYDEYYLTDFCNAEPEDIEIFNQILFAVPSLSSHYNEMYQFIQNHDLADDDNFDVVSEYMDIYNFINYNVQKIFFAVYDWPGNNVRIWRPKVPGGKWRWLSFDNDDGFYYDSLNSINHITADSSDDWRNPPSSTFLFRNLIKNKNFRTKFFATLELRMNTVFRPERIVQRIEELKSIYKPEIDEHIARWNYPICREYWDACIENMKKFAVVRPDIVRQHVSDFLTTLDIDDDIQLDDIFSISVYPNPSSGVINLDLLSPEIIFCNINVTNVLGQVVYTSDSKNYFYYFNSEIDLTEQPDGVYFINFKIDGKTYTKKVLILN